MKKSPVSKLKKNLKILQHLAHCTGEECSHMIPAVKDDVIRVLAQICVNVMNKNLPLNPSEAVRILSPFKKELKAICKKKTSIKTKRKILQQKGGFLPALLGLAIPLIQGLLAK